MAKARHDKTRPFLLSCMTLDERYRERLQPADIDVIERKRKRYLKCEGDFYCRLGECDACGGYDEWRRQGEMRRLLSAAREAWGSDLQVVFLSVSVPNRSDATLQAEEWHKAADSVQLLRLSGKIFARQNTPYLRSNYGYVGSMTHVEVNYSTGVFYRGKKTRQVAKWHKHQLVFFRRSQATPGAWDECDDFALSLDLYARHNAAVAAAAKKLGYTKSWCKPLPQDEHVLRADQYVYPPFRDAADDHKLKGGFVAKIIIDDDGVEGVLPYFFGTSKGKRGFDIAAEMTMTSLKGGSRDATRVNRSYSFREICWNSGLDLGFRKNAIRCHMAVAGRLKVRFWESSPLVGTKKRFPSLFPAPPRELSSSAAAKAERIAQYKRQRAVENAKEEERRRRELLEFDEPGVRYRVGALLVDGPAAKLAAEEFKEKGVVSQATMAALAEQFPSVVKEVTDPPPQLEAAALTRLRTALVRFRSEATLRP